MMVKEFYSNQEAGNEESTLLQDPYGDQEEEEEALSLCDLPIYSDSSISAQLGDEFSKLEDGKNSRSNDNKADEDDDNLFEFFSEEFTTASSTRASSENIIFCGKLIPFKDHPRVPQKNPKSSNTTKRSNNQKKGLNTKSFACDYTSTGKVSLVRSATKSRWFLFMFGMTKLSSNEMQLSDIRNRQSRREPATMFPAPENGKEVVKTEGRVKKNCKGMWKMFRSISLVLGCSSSKLANDVVKAAFV